MHEKKFKRGKGSSFAEGDLSKAQNKRTWKEQIEIVLLEPGGEDEIGEKPTRTGHSIKYVYQFSLIPPP